MKKGFTLIELMIVIAIIAIIAAIAIPGLLAAQRASNERNASASLKTITTAQADFRSNDRDGNLVNDFWTADVFALYGLIPLTGTPLAIPADSVATTGIIKLIEPSVAGADGRSELTLYGNVLIPNSIINGSPKAGYIYRAFGQQDDGAAGGPTTLLVDTDGTPYAALHDRNRFAYAAFPETLSAGKLMYIVNADNTIYKYNLPAGYLATYVPISAAGADSTLAITGSGVAAAGANFDFAGVNTGIFPQAPGFFGCSKMD